MPINMTPNTTLVAITGATGFIGSHLVKALLAKGFTVRILARKPNKTSLKHHSLEVVTGNLHHNASLEILVQGAHYVIHCAGRVRGANQAQFDHDNVQGTQNVIDAASRSTSLKGFIHLSSLAAREPNVSHYAKSKNTAEALVKNINFTEWSIIRPPAVYGPNDKELRPLFDWMKKGILWIPGNPQQKFSLIHVYDLVELIVQEIFSNDHDRVLEPHDGQCYHWLLIAQLCSEFFNRKIRQLTISPSILSAAASLNVLLSKGINYSPMLTPSKVNELIHDDWIASGIPSGHTWAAKIDLKKGLSTLYSS